MSKKKTIKKLKKKLKQFEQILQKDCLTLVNSANANEVVKLSFTDGIVTFNKVTTKIQTETAKISQITFN